ncbi:MULTISPECIES: NfeD family protein [Roseomonadaceae]|uniref:NfeD family protein n=1 Tax=Falsiroseomonas oleicola TaxID=2801474 RepID=A0ABS6H2Y0_9PROT|nr:NfeD family protein [Roseomonas oleicola]MBU8542202.1 NfeD family protein [Roseomonas oleicola]
MEPGLIWILIGLVALGAELLLPGVYILWAGLAAVGTGLLILAMGDLGFGLDVAAFLALLALGIATSLLLRRFRRPAAEVNVPESGLAGRIATLVRGSDGTLRVRLGDSEWPARLPPGILAPPIGASVRVVAVEGVVLVVRPDGGRVG